MLGGAFTKLEESIMGNSPIVNRINGILAEKGISKRDFYQNCGITSASYSQWNTGKTIPRMKNLEIISEYLGTTTDYLLTGLGDKEKTPALKDKHNQQPELDDEQLKVAYFRGADPSLTKEDLDAMWEDAKNFRDFILEKKRREKHGE